MIPLPFRSSPIKGVTIAYHGLTSSPTQVEMTEIDILEHFARQSTMFWSMDKSVPINNQIPSDLKFLYILLI